MIDVRDVTMTYPSGKGIFDVTFRVGEGQVLGYLGPNGAGKTTTIRCLLGFTKPNSGNCTIGGLDCVARAPEIQKTLGYIPGEIAFLDGMTGTDFLKFMAQMRGMRDLSKQKELVERFELDPRKEIKKFSKGMKQKLGIVTAFMHDPPVLILDEPTSGLDPLMQKTFFDLIKKENERGATVLFSSHILSEVQRICDRVAIIKEGKIVSVQKIGELQSSAYKNVGFTPKAGADPKGFSVPGAQKIEVSGQNVSFIFKGDVNALLAEIGRYPLSNVDITEPTLEEIFMHYYSE
jgi:ABC-2 type transport system ATP-binding protein